MSLKQELRKTNGGFSKVIRIQNFFIQPLWSEEVGISFVSIKTEQGCTINEETIHEDLLSSSGMVFFLKQLNHVVISSIPKRRQLKSLFVMWLYSWQYYGKVGLLMVVKL